MDTTFTNIVVLRNNKHARRFILYVNYPNGFSVDYYVKSSVILSLKYIAFSF